MRRSHALLALLALILTSGCQKSGPQASHQANLKVSFEDFQKILLPRGNLLPLPDKNASLLLMRMPEDKYSKIYLLDHESKKFEEQFDFGRNIGSLFQSPDMKDYYLLVDNNGDENYGVYRYDLEKKSVKPLVVFENAQSTVADFSDDYQTLFIRSNHEKKDTYSIYGFDLQTEKLIRITDGQQSWDSALVDAKGRWMVLTQRKGNSEQHVFLLDLNTKKRTKLLAKAGTRYLPSFYHPHQPYLYLISDENRDRLGCGRVRLGAKKVKMQWVRTHPQRDLTCYYSDTTNTTYLYDSHDGRYSVQVYDGVFEKRLSLPFSKDARIVQFTRIPNHDFAYTRIGYPYLPTEYYRVDLTKGKEATPERLSQFNRSPIPEDAFAHSYDFRYPSFDGLEIHGIYYAKPEWLSDGKKRPVIVWPHGGPDGSESHAFRSLFQYWALNGYVVFAPNFRGSAGYGKHFETLNDLDWGGGHIKDLIEGKNAFVKEEFVDADRVFIVGASFGGYSTLSAITQYPQAFKGAVAMVAIANLFTFFESIPPDPAWKSEFLREMGDPNTHKELYEDRSPYFHADKIEVPLKIYQAENDVRTVKAEMDSFVAKLRELNIPVEYEVLENEGHMLSRSSTWEKVLAGTVRFLNNIE